MNIKHNLKIICLYYIFYLSFLIEDKILVTMKSADNGFGILLYGYFILEIIDRRFINFEKCMVLSFITMQKTLYIT